MKQEERLAYKPPQVEVFRLGVLSILENFSLGGSGQDWNDGDELDILEDGLNPSDWGSGGSLGSYD